MPNSELSTTFQNNSDNELYSRVLYGAACDIGLYLLESNSGLHRVDDVKWQKVYY
jgi:hypothetical protein